MDLRAPRLLTVAGGASFSRDRVYRYSLTRVWDGAGPRLCFCLLNPSTADAERDDPTMRRCVAYARDWGYGSMEAVNIFALRSTDPAALRACADPVGPGNDRAIARAAGRCALVVAAWGAHGSLAGRSGRVERLLARAGAPVVCLGRTAAGEPRHPLYLRRDARPEAWP